MSPGKPAGAIKVLVPRHNSQPVSSELDAAIQALVEAQNTKIDTAPAGCDPSSTALSQAIVSSLSTTVCGCSFTYLKLRKVHLNGIRSLRRLALNEVPNGTSVPRCLSF
jgi:hypothetical protein